MTRSASATSEALPVRVTELPRTWMSASSRRSSSRRFSSAEPSSGKTDSGASSMLERTVRAAGPELLAPAPIPVTGLVGSPISPWVRKGRYSPLSGLDSTAARPDALPAGSTSGIPTDQASLTRPTDTPTVNNRQGGLDARVRGPVVWTIEPMTPEHESFDKHDQ